MASLTHKDELARESLLDDNGTPREEASQRSSTNRYTMDYWDSKRRYLIVGFVSLAVVVVVGTLLGTLLSHHGRRPKNTPPPHQPPTHPNSPPSLTADTPWPVMQGNQQRTGVSDFDGPRTCQLAWQLEIPTHGTSTGSSSGHNLVFADGEGTTLIGISADGTVLSIDVDRQHAYEMEGEGSGVVSMEDADFIIRALAFVKDALYEFDTSGNIVSTDNPPNEGSFDTSCAPVFLDHMQSIVALKDPPAVLSRRKPWNVTLNAPVAQLTLSADANLLMVATAKEGVLALDVNDGTQVWTYDDRVSTTTEGSSQQAVAVASTGDVFGSVLSTTFNGTGLFFGLSSDGSVLWEVDAFDCPPPTLATLSPVVTDSLVVFGCADSLVALDHDGKSAWRTALGDGVSLSTYGMIASSDGVLYAGVSSGLVALSLDTGDHLWSFTQESALSQSPAIAPDGTLYVLGVNDSGETQLFAFGKDAGTPCT